jgi:hypothetical protein
MLRRSTRPRLSRLGHCRGLEQHYAICQYRRHILQLQVLDLNGIDAGHAGVACAMKQYVQVGLEADREMANMLAELVIGGSPPSRWPVISDDAVRAPP